MSLISGSNSLVVVAAAVGAELLRADMVLKVRAGFGRAEMELFVETLLNCEQDDARNAVAVN